MRKILIIILVIISAICAGLSVTACSVEKYSTLEMEEGIVYLTDFSVKYTSKEESPYGNIDESTLSETKYGSVQNYYLVMQFDMQTASEILDMEYLTIEFIVFDADVLGTTVNYANTSSTSQTTTDGRTSITATYSLPDKAKLIKNVYIVIELIPKMEGGTDIIYNFSSDNKEVTGYDQTECTYQLSKKVTICNTSLEYTLSNDGLSYTVAGIGTKESYTYYNEYAHLITNSNYVTINIDNLAVYIRETYNGLPVTAIAYDAFYNCDIITKVYIPESVVSIGKEAFYNCSLLTDVLMSDNIKYIGENAFYGCDGLTYYCSSDVYYLGNYKNNYIVLTGVANSSATSYTISEGTRIILHSAFKDCTKLTDIIIPDSVVFIGNMAFYNCYCLTNLNIPASVTNIGSDAFYKCKLVTYEYDNGYYIGNDTNNYMILYDVTTGVESFTVNENTKYIYNSAFAGCTKLVDITIPAGMLAIGESAFEECTSLENVYITDLAAWCNISFGNPSSNPLYHNGNLYIGDEITTENSVEIAIPDGVTSIGAYAFYNCQSINGSILFIYMTLPESVTYIGSCAFYNCDSLLEINLPDSLITIGSSAFAGCSWLKTITIGSKTTTIGDSAFYNCPYLQYVTIGDGVTYIGGAAFYSCELLKSVTIGSSVATIEGHAFADCEILTEIVIPDSVTVIGSYAFSGCTALKKVTMGSGVTTIGDSAFENCYALTGITIPDSVTTIGDSAFSQCESLTSITIPDSVTEIGDMAFYSCSDLKTVTIGSGVERIGKKAFIYCHSLNKVTFKNTSGWYVTATKGYSDGSSVTVTKANTNASYFTDTYSDYYWYRSDN